MERSESPSAPAPVASEGADINRSTTFSTSIASLGGQVWFDVPIMLAMLAMGTFALLYDGFSDAFYARIVLGIYASGVALNLIDSLVRLRPTPHDPRLPAWARWRGEGYPAFYNVLLDAAFAAAVLVFDEHDENSILVTMLVLTGTRLLAHTAARPMPRVRGMFVPTIGMVLVLPLLPILLQEYYTPAGQAAPTELFGDAALIGMLLVVLYAIMRNLNQRIAEEASLATTVELRDRELRQSQIQAEQDAKRLAEQVLRLDLLQDGIRAMNSAIELGDLLLMIVNNAVRVLKAEQSSIGLVDPATGELVIQCATGVDAAQLRRRRFLPGVGVAGWVVQNGKALIVDDVRRDVRYVDPYTDDAIGRTTRSMLCVPLMVEGNVIGTLQVTHSQPGALNSSDQEMLTSFAQQAALAVHKSTLLEERTRQGEELRRRGELITSLHSIGQSVLSSLELPQVLDTFISRINELSTFDHGVIYLLNERTGEEELVATAGDSSHEHPELSIAPGTPADELWRHSREHGTAQYATDEFTILSVPLVNRGKAVGCIMLGRGGNNPFTDVESDTAEKLAHAVTIAIVNARLFSRVSVGQRQTSALYRLMLEVNAAPNRRQLAVVICRELQHITGAKGAALLINDAFSRMACWATSGKWNDLDMSSVALAASGTPFMDGVFATLHQMDQPDLLVVHRVPPEIRALCKTPNCVTIPLAQGGRIYGLLVLEPGSNPPIPVDIKETVSLAVQHSTVALERAELFEQTLTAARQSSMLYSIAAEVQTSLNQDTVVRMTVNGAVEALPVESCELYLFEPESGRLVRSGRAKAPGADNAGEGPETITVNGNDTLAAVLKSPGLVLGDVDGLGGEAASDAGQTVVLGRLMGSEEPLGLLRLTTQLKPDEFLHRHATFCQTLLTHSGGALERSRLYTTTSDQAKMLRQRAQQLTDILNLGSLSAADRPLSTILPQLAAGIARSLGLAYVRIGEVGPDEPGAEAWAWADKPWADFDAQGGHALTHSGLERLMAQGTPIPGGMLSVYLDEHQLAERVEGQAAPRGENGGRRLVLMLLNSTAGETLGYILGALARETLDGTSEHDLLEVLGIFAQRTALIVENHRVYSQLLDSNRKMEAVVLSIGDGVIVTDAEMRILMTNSLADRLMATGKHGSRGYPIEDLVDNPDLIGMLTECLADSSSNIMDVDLRLGRELRTYEAVVHPIAASETEVVGAVITLRDVTAERATERAKSDFLSIVSHELRTPLNSVMGFLDIILMGKTGPLNDLQQDFLGTAKQEAVVLQRLINDLLDYSQLWSGMLRLEMAPLNLSSVISRVVNQAIPRMQEEELTLTNDVPAGLLVIGDEIRLEQVFKNLLDNAAKFTDAEGGISFASHVNSETVTISVHDTGCGIPPAQMSGVFDKFFQAENSSSRQKRGLGLGLAICKNIVERHGGRIWLESEVGVGTTVYVELLLFKPNSTLYDFDVTTGKATLVAPAGPAVRE